MTKRYSLTLVLAICWLTQATSAAGINQSPLYHGDPLHLLPPQVDASKEGLSLFADYAHPTMEGQIPIYLINRSSKDVELEIQDDRIYAMLEHQNETGQWQRAQPHFYSWCGNSYYTLTLRPGYFIKRLGYQSRQGRQSG